MKIQGKRVWIAGQFMAAQMEIEDGVISRIHEYGAGPADEDYGDKRIVPGFIDIHTHGAYDFDTNDGQPEGLRNWMKRIPEEGATAILPTTVTQMPDVLTRAVATVAAVVKDGYEGAEILGSPREGRRKPLRLHLWSSLRNIRRRQKALSNISLWRRSGIRTMRLPDTVPPTEWWSAWGIRQPLTSRLFWELPTALYP